MYAKLWVNSSTTISITSLGITTLSISTLTMTSLRITVHNNTQNNINVLLIAANWTYVIFLSVVMLSVVTPNSLAPSCLSMFSSRKKLFSPKPSTCCWLCKKFMRRYCQNGCQVYSPNFFQMNNKKSGHNSTHNGQWMDIKVDTNLKI
jgi:hypothetical protein